MPNPWDAGYIETNLATLGSLQPGDKLSLLKKGEGEGEFAGLKGSRGLRSLFKIQAADRKLKALLRAKKRESIQDARQALEPLRRFFSAATNAYAASTVDGSDLIGAFNGLLTLRDTYDRVGNAKDRAAIARIVREVELALPLELRVINVPHGTSRTDLLTDPRFTQIRQALPRFITDMKAEAVAEYEDAAMAKTVFGEGAKPAARTTLPTLSRAYQRALLRHLPGVQERLHRPQPAPPLGRPALHPERRRGRRAP